ncbi:Hypothetical protein FKW44_003080 [Caligus rogercresseyi]|uniref:Uncharacterized protein n=1 Tax=Caligus rogercresseyi TaxID=217165 RepID=A0A7T8KLG3_CALRO|nr:Hypothetical protein FKW44_003080 [Caligus rogercresseyi]
MEDGYQSSKIPQNESSVPTMMNPAGTAAHLAMDVGRNCGPLCPEQLRMRFSSTDRTRQPR